MYYLRPVEEQFTGSVICAMLDVLILLPTMVGTMYAMLQDRRRSLWPMAVPIAIAEVFYVCVFFFSAAMQPLWLPSSLLLLVYVMILVLRAVRQYGRWLRENYADLEYKEVWQNSIILAAFLLCSTVYNLEITNILLQYILQVIDLVLIVALLWRVEKLQRLDVPRPRYLSVPDSELTQEAQRGKEDEPNEKHEDKGANIAEMLQQFCIGGKFYLNNDVSLTQLAEYIGADRTDLNRYFAEQDLSFNTYINGLRVRHFVGLYQQAIASKRPFTIRQLAFNSGFSSYSSFCTAFKEAMELTVVEWTHEQRK